MRVLIVDDHPLSRAGVRALLSGLDPELMAVDVASVAEALQRPDAAGHFDLVLLIQLPLMGGLCALVFRDAHLTLPEHMVLIAYTLSVRAAALTLTVPIVLLSSNVAPTSWQTSAFWGAWYVYFGWAASQFYGGTRWRAWLRLKTHS